MKLMRFDHSVRGALVAAALAVPALVAPRQARAQGFGLNEIGTCSVARAGAGVAESCPDASRIFWNPATAVRLPEKVRKKKAKPIGPLVILDQERCVLCSRCVRFVDEVTHTSELAFYERGDHVELDLAPNRTLDNPYSGNVVDICPVGALTSRDFRFRARVWYLERTESVCGACANGCNINVYHREGRIFRFQPRDGSAYRGGVGLQDVGRGA